MAKLKTVYVCTQCGAESPKWIGKCPSCGEWNSYVEEVISSKSSTTQSPSYSTDSPRSKPQKLEEISISQEERIDFHDTELNRVLGGGTRSGVDGIDRWRARYRKIYSRFTDRTGSDREKSPLCIGRRKCSPTENESRQTTPQQSRLLYRM